MKITDMKTGFVSLAAVLALSATSCTNEMESGLGYPALELGSTTVVYKIDKVLQNDVDVKPYLSLFDGVELKLSYEDGKPSVLAFSEAGAPFRVTSLPYEGTLEAEWEINTAKSPYEIRIKATGELLCYITRDRLITFPFKLGAASNKYEYQLLPVVNSENQ